MKIKKVFIRLLIGVFWTCLALEMPPLLLKIAWPAALNDTLWLLGPASCCALIIRWFYVQSIIRDIMAKFACFGIALTIL